MIQPSMVSSAQQRIINYFTLGMYIMKGLFRSQNTIKDIFTVCNLFRMDVLLLNLQSVMAHYSFIMKYIIGSSSSSIRRHWCNNTKFIII